MSLTEKPSVEEEHSKVGDLLLCVRLDHDVAVDEDGADDGEGEERVREHVDGDATDGVERRQHEQGVVGWEPEDGAALRDDDEGALVLKVWVDVADGRAGELQRELAIPTRQIVSWKGCGILCNKN